MDLADSEATFRRRVARVLGWCAGLIAAGVLWAGIVASSAGEGTGLGPFPAFDLPTLSNDGPVADRLDGEALAGQVVVVNFWASWCPPCRAEMPILVRVASDLEERGVTFLGVVHQDRDEPAREFAERMGVTYPNVMDDGSLAAALGVRAIPTTFVVDASGEVVARHFGPIREGRLRVLIEDALARSESSAASGGGE